jgi:hydrogenase 3 maturation protease
LSQLESDAGNSPRIAILGVGNAFRSDDAAGVLVARALSTRQHARDERLLVLEAGSAPENRTGELRRFAPDLVLFIDAAEMGEEPGAVCIIPEEAIDGMSASTHSLPLSLLAQYLSLELKCKVVLLGIQPRSKEVGETISVSVSQAIRQVADLLESAICMSLSHGSPA